MIKLRGFGILGSTLVLTLLMMMNDTAAENGRRVPAEWEPQAAVWLQWPGRYEKAHEPAFANMARIIVQYQPLHILAGSQRIREQADRALRAAGADPQHANLIWHQIPNDSAWMRDNGPVYVAVDGELKVQNWEFDAWGGAFGSDIPYDLDNQVPDRVADYLGLERESVDIVHERGNLEFNGVDTVILNWSTIGDPARNPDYTRDKAEADLKRNFGVTRVVFVEGVPDGDRTKGHIDGLARFINADTVVVPECAGSVGCSENDRGIYDQTAATIQDAGFHVIRDPVEATVNYRGMTFTTNYMNWLVGNGFVLVVGFGHPEADAAAKARIEGYFPGRDVHVIEMLSSWADGGGVHCHTNDQPAL